MPYYYNQRMNVLNAIKQIQNVPARMLALTTFIEQETKLLNALQPPLHRSQALDIARKALGALMYPNRFQIMPGNFFPYNPPAPPAPPAPPVNPAPANEPNPADEELAPPTAKRTKAANGKAVQVAESSSDTNTMFRRSRRLREKADLIAAPKQIDEPQKSPSVSKK